MKKILLILFAVLCCAYSFSQYKDSLQLYIDDYVKNHEVVTGDNKKYLQFYPIDESYRVVASFQKTSNPKWLRIETSSKQTKNFRIYGVLSFKLQDTVVKLNVYQAQDLLQDPKYKDYLLVM